MQRGCRLGTRSQGDGWIETWLLGATGHFDRAHVHGLLGRVGRGGVLCGRGQLAPPGRGARVSRSTCPPQASLCALVLNMQTSGSSDDVSALAKYLSPFEEQLP